MATVAPLQAALLQDPIAFLSAEHARQTVLLRHLERLARAPQGRGAKELAGAVVSWLTQEFPLHVADEEGSLYPRLLAFDAERIVPLLTADHLRDRESLAGLAAGLRRIAKGKEPEPGFAALALDFVAGHRRHLALEEAVLMPLSLQVLSRDELAVVAAEMSGRRGRGQAPHA